MNGIRQCEEFCAFHIDHIDGCYRWRLAQLGQQKDLREHLHIKLLRYLTYALNHCNPIVKTCSDIALRCALSPMGANVARLLRYLYDVSFDRKLHVMLMSSLSVIGIRYIVIVSSMQQSVY